MREGWKTVAVEDVAEVVAGGTPKSSQPEFWGGDVQWLTPKDLADRPARYTGIGARTITEEGLKKSAAKLLPKGTVLLTSRAPVGYVSIASGPIATNQGFKNLILDDTQLPSTGFTSWDTQLTISDQIRVEALFKRFPARL